MDTVVVREQLVHTVTVRGASTVAVVAQERLQVITVGQQGPAGAAGAGGGVLTVSYPAGSALGGNRAVRLSAGLVVYADSTVPAHANRVLGITTGAAAQGASATIQTAGPMIEPSWAWTPDQPIFCGPAGTLTQTPPASGFSLVLGIALTATQVHIGAKTPITLN